VIVEFVSHPDGEAVRVEMKQVRAILRARGGLPFTLIRFADDREVVVRGTKDQIQARLEQTAEGPALRIE
jgi:hypothetical protein